jgi:hypothetical protein
MEKHKKNLTSSVLNKIKEDKITPLPRWEFLLKNYLIWGFGSVSLVLGGLTASVTIYMISNDDWEIYQNISGSFTEFIILTLPYFWLVFLAFFIWLVNYNFKHTENGYKINIKIIAVSSVALSMLFGLFLYNLGMGKALDDLFSSRLPFYRHVINHRINLWVSPQEGRLIGQINTVNGQELELADPEGRIWTVEYDFIPPMIADIIMPGEKVKLIGRQIGERYFKAERILPMGPGRGCFDNPMPGGCRLELPFLMPIRTEEMSPAPGHVFF